MKPLRSPLSLTCVGTFFAQIGCQQLLLILMVLGVGRMPVSADLVGQWTFDEGGGTAIAGSSGQANHGTLINAKPTSWTNGVHGGAVGKANSVSQTK